MEKQISDAEWEVMRVLWETDEISADAVFEQIKDSTRWKIKTLKTLINRLVNKEIIGYRADGKKYLYKALAKKDDCIVKESQTFLNKIFDGANSSLLLHFVEKESLSIDEIDELENLLKQKRNLLKQKK